MGHGEQGNQGRKEERFGPRKIRQHETLAQRWTPRWRCSGTTPGRGSLYISKESGSYAQTQGLARGDAWPSSHRCTCNVVIGGIAVLAIQPYLGLLPQRRDGPDTCVCRLRVASRNRSRTSDIREGDGREVFGMTRFALVGVMIVAGLFTPAAIADQAGDRTASRCTVSKDLMERARCESLAPEVGKRAAATEQGPCGRTQSGCGGEHGNRTARPPFWVGHHYSGL